MMIHSVYWIVFLSVILFLSQTVVINTLVAQRSPYFESGVVNLIQTSSTSSQYTYAVTYRVTKSLWSRVMISYNSVDYDLNRKYTGNGTLLLNIDLSLYSSSNTGFTALAQTITYYQLKMIKYSYFVMDNSFPYFSSFTLNLVAYSSKNSCSSVNHAATNPKFVIFLRNLNFEIYPYSSTSIELFGF